MRSIYPRIPDYVAAPGKVCLATLVATRGSAPQSAGSAALFSEQGLLAGTLGGGIMEGDAQERAGEAIRTGRHLLYDFHLDADINDSQGAICGGSATILLDPDPGRHTACFTEMKNSLLNERPGCLVTHIPAATETAIHRSWFENEALHLARLASLLIGNTKLFQEDPKASLDHRIAHDPRMSQDRTDPEDQPGSEDQQAAGERGQVKSEELAKALRAATEEGKSTCLFSDAGDLLFIEPVFPLPHLVIAGAGHIGRALAHLAGLLDFEVTVMDDRPEFANAQNIPDADHFIVQPIGKAMADLPKTRNTYVVIVTRGHHDDAAALKECIGHNLPYIGMIGSRRKIRSVKEKFLAEGWATKEEFEQVHAPIGLEIGSVSVQEIALSIAAQLVQERAAVRKGRKREQIAALILAAGESRRMGKPKMLLPFGDATILRTVIRNAQNALTDHLQVVLGAHAEAIREDIDRMQVKQVLNTEYQNGMASSVQAGIRSLPAEITAVMVLLGDQPMIPSATMDRLIQHYKHSEKNIIIATVDGKRGHPVIFGKVLFPAILALKNGENLRDLIGKYPGEVELVETGRPEILRDIDTPGDYEKEKPAQIHRDTHSP